jgi:hypothetical protein
MKLLSACAFSQNRGETSGTDSISELKTLAWFWAENSPKAKDSDLLF